MSQLQEEKQAQHSLLVSQLWEEKREKYVLGREIPNLPVAGRGARTVCAYALPFLLVSQLWEEKLEKHVPTC